MRLNILLPFPLLAILALLIVVYLAFGNAGVVIIAALAILLS